MSIRTLLLDSDNDQQNRRTIFRLPDGMYKADLKLLNVGFTNATVTDRPNSLAGVFACVKQISLLDGAIVLDSINRANILQGFRTYNQTNNENRDLSKDLQQSNLGFAMEGEKIQTYYNSDNVEATEDATARGWFDLSQMFPFLRTLKYVDSRMFPKFRVVIEYDSSDPSIWLSQDASNKDSKTTEPLMKVEEVIDPNVLASYWNDFKGIAYASMEVDSVRLPPVEPTAGNSRKVQSENFRINGFNGKTLNRMLVTKNDYTVVDGISSEYKTLASETMNKQKFQVRVNGANIFPRDGVISNNERLGMLSQTWGVCNNIPAANSLPFVDSVNYVEDHNDDLSHLDYFGCNIGYKIEDLVLDYERQAVYDSGLPDQKTGSFNRELELNVFGEVLKRLVYQDGKYIIAYI